jgi:hypothetical protein
MSPRVLASLVYCGAAFGGSFLFMRLAAPELPALIVAFGRVTVAALILLPFAGRERLAAMRAHWRDYVIVGFFMAAAPFALFAYAERSLTAGLGSIINATTPLWTAIVLAAWLRQAPTPRRVAAIVVGFVGVGVIVGLEGLQLAPDALAGVLAATAGAASYGIALTYMRRRMAPQPPLQLALGRSSRPPSCWRWRPRRTPRRAGSVASGSFLDRCWPILRLNHDAGPMATSTVTFSTLFGSGAFFLARCLSPDLVAAPARVRVACRSSVPLPARLSGAAAGPVAAAVRVDEAD